MKALRIGSKLKTSITRAPERAQAVQNHWSNVLIDTLRTKEQLSYIERHKDALAAQKLEEPKQLSTLFNEFLNEIALQQ